MRALTNIINTIGEYFFDNSFRSRESQIETEVHMGNPIAFTLSVWDEVSTPAQADTMMQSREYQHCMAAALRDLMTWLRTEMVTDKWAIETGFVVGNSATVMLLNNPDVESSFDHTGLSIRIGSMLSAQFARYLDARAQFYPTVCNTFTSSSITTSIMPLLLSRPQEDAEDYVTALYNHYQAERNDLRDGDRNYNLRFRSANIGILFVKPTETEPGQIVSPFTTIDGFDQDWMEIITSLTVNEERDAISNGLLQSLIRQEGDSDSDYVPDGSDRSSSSDSSGEEEYPTLAEHNHFSREGFSDVVEVE